MIFTETQLKGAYLIEPERLKDERGFFARSFCCKEFKEHRLDLQVVQCNISYNTFKGTLRGMHYQVAPKAEAKLVCCTRGAIHDVIIDLRPDSVTRYQWISIKLSADNLRMLYIPKEFAHGFQTLEDNTEIFYMMSEFYSPDHARGLRWDDPVFGIEWPLKEKIISDKDRNRPLMNKDILPSAEES